MTNLYSDLRSLFPSAPLLIGTISAIDISSATITLLGGGVVSARGGSDMVIGDTVYLRDGVIEGLAPNLPFVDIVI